jgi:hypothetical protein
MSLTWLLLGAVIGAIGGLGNGRIGGVLRTFSRFLGGAP